MTALAPSQHRRLIDIVIVNFVANAVPGRVGVVRALIASILLKIGLQLISILR